MDKIKTRTAIAEDAKAIQTLVRQVFDEFVAPDYSSQGNEEFHKYIQIDTITERLAQNHWAILAFDHDSLVAIAEVRANSHLSMLFVDKNYQHQGIASRLLKQVISQCQAQNPQLKKLTVHASPNSVSTYRRMGFTPSSPEQEKNGIRFTTMKLNLN